METNGNEKPVDSPSGYFEDAPDGSRDMAPETLQRIGTTGSISISPEQFERLYLQPLSQVKGDLRKTFGNPTPLALAGLVMTMLPLSCQLMGWRGSGKLGSATIGVYYFLGGPALWIAAILEFFLGNTFTFVVFFIYGGLDFGWGASLHPFYNGAGAYAADGLYGSGLKEPSFWASLGNPITAFCPLTAGIITFVFMIGATRINFAFMIGATRINFAFMMVFFTVGCGFLMLSGAFWEQGLGDAVLFDRLCQGGGGSWFATSLIATYLLFIQIMDAVGFKLPLPVGDLTGFWIKRENRNKSSGEV
ncbi:hypothetical protein DOTSEDRAFT_181338 [Dothistroma septosporum NZE10]|uniref:GPR1/FUN34/YaaH-class plasma membrane protein n=1 Tax=Dothistroma septosporum (strain NZE10 / CBS 128990) TaxID=675120 RepID=N1PBG5_DOTSN|nr:hypothetical protein DOTSEDRAFT_181338 [Dothistroma septosporum NZE10]